MNRNNIERSVSRIWKKSCLEKVVKACKAEGFDIITTSDSIVIGLIDRYQLVLRAIRGTSAWLTRYDRKLFDENAV